MLNVTKEQHEALIAAANLLCDFVGKNLPDGWDIRLWMTHGEATAELIDPSGEEVETDSADYGVSTIANLVEIAIERAADFHANAE